MTQKHQSFKGGEMTSFNPGDEVRSIVNESIRKLFGDTPVELQVIIPPKPEMGDFSVAMFPLGKHLKRNPETLAADLALFLNNQKPNAFSEIKALKAYVNFFFNNSHLAGTLFANLAFSSMDAIPTNPVMVEFLSPNTNKPLHLGHLRNAFLGDAVSRLISATKLTVIKANLLNDRGIHICKSMVAYTRESQGVSPGDLKVKGDHFVGKFYVRFEMLLRQELKDLYRQIYVDVSNIAPPFDEVKAQLEEKSLLLQEAKALLQKWEQNDAEVRTLWRTMDSWVVAGFKETLENLGIFHDCEYRESNTYTLGKKIVEEGLKRGIFYTKDDNSVWVDLTLYELGQKLLLRGDGTSVYMTQDLGTAVLKQEEYGISRSIYVVADEQNHHFQVLFKILEILGYDWARGMHHLSYGLVELPQGRMKSREGTVVDADDLMKEVIELAYKITQEKSQARKQEISPEELRAIARVVGLGALKFQFLSVRPTSKIKFNPEEAVSFDGKTGPFVQYVYARIQSMLRRAAFEPDKASNNPESLQQKDEHPLLVALVKFSSTIAEAALELDPSILADYLFELAQAYNTFYKTCPVLKVEDRELRDSRLTLSYLTALTIKKGLYLLGIEVPEQM